MIRLPRSSRLLVNPAHAALLQRAGLREARDFLALRQEIVSGHPDRQVSRVDLGGMTAYLKREHRVPWRERLRNLWAGFGLSSKSWREAQVLRSRFDLCPDWIAAGELADGQAFLLVRAVDRGTPLPRLLESLRDDPCRRRRLARALGGALGRLHASGTIHGDLYAHHVLIAPDTLQPIFLDWQRATRKSNSSWRDLATLAATLSLDAMTRTDLMVFVRAYRGALAPRLRADAIRQEVNRLRQRRHIQAKIKGSAEGPSQSLLCLDGDALRVTSAFRRLWPETPPPFLLETHVEDCAVALPDGEYGHLIRRCHRLSWWRRRGVRRRTWTSPERWQMNLLNRLERFGIEAPRVLAAGERPLSENRVSAFLLTRPPPGATPLDEWLARSQDEEARNGILREAGVLLAQLHEAGCIFYGQIRGLGRTPQGLILLDAAALTIRRRLRGLWRRRDLHRLCELHAETASDRACVHQGYWSLSTSREA